MDNFICCFVLEAGFFFIYNLWWQGHGKQGHPIMILNYKTLLKALMNVKWPMNGWKLRVVHVPGKLGTFSPPLRVSDPDMHMPWCMPGSLTSGFLWSRCRRKLSRHFRSMHNPQFNVFGNKPMGNNFQMHLLGLIFSTPGWTIHSKIWYLGSVEMYLK